MSFTCHGASERTILPKMAETIIGVDADACDGILPSAGNAVA
jgi:hypothetical protein